jgi:hypothetical protein
MTIPHIKAAFSDKPDQGKSDHGRGDNPGRPEQAEQNLFAKLQLKPAEFPPNNQA